MLRFRSARWPDSTTASGSASPGSRCVTCRPRTSIPQPDRFVAHVGNSVPARSATMYAAYQSGQSGSALPMRFSCSPCASAARTIALARSLAEPNDFAAGSTRPGKPGRDFLEQPAVAVRVGERGERAVRSPGGTPGPGSPHCPDGGLAIRRVSACRCSGQRTAWAARQGKRERLPGGCLRARPAAPRAASRPARSWPGHNARRSRG